MWMSDSQIYSSWKNSQNREKQIQVLSELNDEPEESVLAAVRRGERYSKKHKASYPKNHIYPQDIHRKDALFAEKPSVKVNISGNNTKPDTPKEKEKNMAANKKAKPNTKNKTRKTAASGTAGKILTSKMMDEVISGRITIKALSKKTGIPASTVSWHVRKYRTGLPDKAIKNTRKNISEKKICACKEAEVCLSDISPEIESAVSSGKAYLKALEDECIRLRAKIDELGEKLEAASEKKQALAHFLNLMEKGR